jgi:uncharacterized protein YukJ
LDVTLNAPGAKWSVDNGAWQNSGAVVTGLSVGAHTVAFNALSGWTTPATQTITIADNQTTSIAGTFVANPQSGSLEVTLNAAGAQWSVDNGAWQNSGATVSGLAVGTHTITFSTLFGWVTPANQTISVAEDQTTSIAAAYVAVPQTGSLQVTLNPAVTQWAVDNGAWQNSGTVVSGLSVGSHTVTFGPLSGWTAPASQTISISANQTNSITATYIAAPQTGSLQVTLSPAVTQWAVDNGAWQNSGTIVSGLLAGPHTLTFSALAGWITPASQTNLIVANQTNSIAVNYVFDPQTGSGPPTVGPAGTQLPVYDKGLQARHHKTRRNQSGSVTANQRNTLTDAAIADARGAGTYNGLFYPADAVAQSTSGMLSGLTVTTNGRYSGKILIGGMGLPITGTFDVAGHASQVVVRPPNLGGAMTLDMTLTLNGALTQIVGTVSGTNGVPWVANLLADAAATSNQSYQYTLLFPSAAAAPAGFGYATIGNYRGTAMVVARLADGASFSQNVPVSADGSTPLYAAIGTNELVLGWITNLYSSTPGGEIVWIKGDSSKPVKYTQGFTNLITVTGSVWTNAAPNHADIALENESFITQ